MLAAASGVQPQPALVDSRTAELLSGLVRSLELLRSLGALQVLEAIGDKPARRILGRLGEGAPASHFLSLPAHQNRYLGT